MPCSDRSRDELVERMEMLRASEEKFRALFENMVQGAFYQRRDGELIDCNPAVLRMFGLSRDEFMARTSLSPQWKVIHKDGSDFPGEEHPSMEALRTGKPVLGVVVGVFNPRKKDYVWVSINAIPQFKPGDDEPYQAFVTLHDITDRQKAEEVLRELAGRYRTLCTTTADAFWEVDGQGRIVEVNDQCCRMYGYSRKELLSMAVQDFEDTRNPDETRAHIEEIRAKGHARFETRHHGKNGRLLHIEVSTTYRPQSDTFLTFIHDITERKRAEATLRDSESRLRAIIDAEPECVKLLASDGRLLEMNPAGLSMIEADRDEVMGKVVYGLVTPEHRDAFRALNESVCRGGSGTLEFQMVGLKGRPLWLATHAVPFRLATEAEPCALAVTRDITERKRMEDALRERDAWLQAFFDNAAIGIAIADTTGRFLQVNEHYLDMFGYANRDELFKKTVGELTHPDDRASTREAQRRLARGDVPFLQLEKRYLRKDGTFYWGHLSVASIREVNGDIRAFEPFFTTKEPGKGTGMGLASVYGTVSNHQGAIEVDSEVGRGTTMTVYLPLAQQEVQEDTTGGNHATEKSSGGRILLVDDERSVRESTAELLRAKGYKVVTAKDGGEAIEYYGKSWEHIDLVVVDMNMPVMNGRDTFIAMRKTNPDVKAILATGYSLDSRAQEILDEGALSHVQKPFRIRDLVQQIEQGLGG